jgi:hypothetical protein
MIGEIVAAPVEANAQRAEHWRFWGQGDADD